MSTTETPEPAPELAYYCPACGKRWEIQTYCTGEEGGHTNTPTLTEPITEEHKTNDQAASELVEDPGSGAMVAPETIAPSEVPRLMAQLAELQRANAELATRNEHLQTQLDQLQNAAPAPAAESGAPVVASVPAADATAAGGSGEEPASPSPSPAWPGGSGV